MFLSFVSMTSNLLWYYTVINLPVNHTIHFRTYGYILDERLFLDSGTLTPLLKKMEVQGLIKRERDPNDPRSVIVTITAKGQDLRQKAVSIPGKIGAFINLKTEEAETLYRLLYQVLGQV